MIQSPPITPGYEKFILPLLVGIAVKVVWDWAVSGRIKKEAPYVTTGACEKHREKCCIGQTKRDVVDLSARIAAAEKRLDQGSQDFREVKKDLAAINETLAGMQVLIETKIEKIVMKGGA